MPVRSLALACVVVALGASAASADPVIDRWSAAVAKGRSVVLTVETTLAGKGQVTLTGDVTTGLSVVPVTMTKKVKKGSRKTKFTIDAKKLKLAKLVSGLTFTLHVTATETGGLATGQDVTPMSIPVPCVALPDFGNEQTPGAFDVFAGAVDLAAGGRYGTSGAKPTLRVHEYASLTKSLAALGKELDKEVRTALKGTIFTKVDLVGYGYGGLVARSYLSQRGGSRVRNCVFLGTANEGSPVTYMAVGALSSPTLAPAVAGNPAFSGLATLLGGSDAKQAARNLYPTYTWLSGSFFSVLGIKTVLGDASTPLTALNQSGPTTGVSFHAYYYDGAGVTVDLVDADALMGTITGGGLDVAALASGQGDGLVPAHSVLMSNESGWASEIAKDAVGLGAGTHPGLLIDPRVIAGVALTIGK